MKFFNEDDSEDEDESEHNSDGIQHNIVRNDDTGNRSDSAEQGN